MKRRGRPPAGQLPEPKQPVAWSLTRTKLSGSHCAIDGECVQQVSWLGAEPDEDEAPDVGLYFWLGEPGFAEVIPGADFAGDINQRLDAENARPHGRDIWLTVHAGAFLRKSSVLRIPATVIAHVSGDASEQSHFWIFGSGDTLQLWGDARRAREVAEASDRLRRGERPPFSGY